MDTRLDPRGSRASGRVVIDIIDGRPWTASRIRNNNLRQNCRMLGRTFRQKTHSVPAGIRTECRRLFGAVMEHSGILTGIHPSQRGVVPSLVRMAWYHKSWRRLPEDWRPADGLSPQEQWSSLLDHLFLQRHRLPAFFESAWLTNGPLTHLERDLYCHAAAGFSLRSAEAMPRSVTARALHLAMQAPGDFTIRQALRRGQVKALGGTDSLVAEVLASRMVHDFGNDRVWLRLLAKVVPAARAGSGAFGMLVDLLLPQLRDGRTCRVEQLLALPMKDLLRHARRHWMEIRDQYRNEGMRFRTGSVQSASLRSRLDYLVRGTWPLMPGTLRFEEFRHGKWHWQFHQLTSHLQLIEEGRKMDHCVQSYRDRCAGGGCAIFSVRLAAEPRVTEAEHCFTVEVSPKSRKIWQVRNRNNRWLSLRQVPAIRHWGERNGLTSYGW